MLISIKQFFNTLGLNDQWAIMLSIGVIVLGIVIVSLLTNFFARRCLADFLSKRSANSRFNHFRLLSKRRVLQRAAHLAPSLVVYLAAPLLIVEGIPLTETVAGVIRMFIQIYTIIVAYLVVSALLDYVEDLYNLLDVAKRRPIKSYLQVAKIALFIIGVIVIAAIILDRSPLALLTGLGALTAVTSLIFKDSIMGFVASIQLGSYDMVRIGDWIEMSSYGADGDVIDMSLNTVKVRNFDNTIVTIPTPALLTNGVKNWRGMSESGGRRIKRCVHIDMHSIQFCSEEDILRYKKIQYIADYIQSKDDEIKRHNQQKNIDKAIRANGRNLTNVGLFRAYLIHYLKNHPRIHKNMTFLVRQLAPTEHGLPIEVYVFTNTTNWVEYEGIQADVFDHILAAIGYFDLRVFQDISDMSTPNLTPRVAIPHLSQISAV